MLWAGIPSTRRRERRLATGVIHLSIRPFGSGKHITGWRPARLIWMEAAPKKLSPALQLGIVGLIAVGLLVLALVSSPPQRTGDLPQAQLVRLDGSSVQLQSGKPTVLTVWATWCTYCQRQLPEFEAIARQRPDVHFAFVNDGEPAQLVRQFHDTRGFASAVVYQDALRTVSRSLRVNGYPSNFFYDSKGKLLGEVRGYMSPDQLQAALAQLN